MKKPIFKIGQNVKISDINNYNDYVEYYNAEKLSNEYLKNTIFTINDFEVRYTDDVDNELYIAYHYELTDTNRNKHLELMIDEWALFKK